MSNTINAQHTITSLNIIVPIAVPAPKAKIAMMINNISAIPKIINNNISLISFHNRTCKIRGEK